MNFYFDMDGVLVIFSEKDAITKPFNNLGKHYFRTCKPDTTAIQLMEILSLIPNHKTNVLTRLYLNIEDQDLLESLLDEHLRDKQIWCDMFIHNQIKNVKFLHTRQTKNKNAVLNNIPENERSQHVLIDDDPNILSAWQNAGGTAIQFLQPNRNVDRFNNGLTIFSTDPVMDSFRKIQKYLNMTEPEISSVDRNTIMTAEEINDITNLISALEESGLDFRPIKDGEEGGIFYTDENGNRCKFTENIFIKRSMKYEQETV